MRYRLKDIFDLQMGKTPARQNMKYWDKSDCKWISIADLSRSEKYISNTKEKISDIAVKETGIRVIPANTVIMSFKLSIGKVAITADNMYSNEAIMAFNDKHVVEMLPEYIFYMFKYMRWDSGSNNAVMGKTLNKATISEIEIDICSIKKQQEIVAILDKMDNILSNKYKNIYLLDELVKARFIEVFGDMLLNSKSWREIRLDSVADIVSGITKGRKIKSAEIYEVPYMAVSNVKNGYIDWTKVKTIMATKEEIKRYQLLPNDVLMTEGGDPDKLGRGAIIKSPPNNCIHQNHIFRVRLNEEILPIYFEYYLQQIKAKRYFLKCSKQTTGIASINMKQLMALPVLIPDMESQKTFAKFTEQADKSKAVIEKSLKELETLQASLMQKYFS